MKTTLISLVLLVLVVLVVSCKKKKSLTETEPSVSEQVSPMPAEEEAVPPAVVEIKEGADQMGAPDEIKSVKIVPDYQPKATDPYELVKAEVSGDELLLVVSYGGGCEPHEFELVTNKVFMKSMPPQLVLTLEHKANNDMCRAYLTEGLTFDLKTIRYPGSKSVRLRINGEGGKEVLYTYE
ncbi:MAG: hypothetical protein JNM00_16230 [Flavobacteriales bacterium]|nr:hypothetical protein [Flavobacteriales bacterium]